MSYSAKRSYENGFEEVSLRDKSDKRIINGYNNPLSSSAFVSLCDETRTANRLRKQFVPTTLTTGVSRTR